MEQKLCGSTTGPSARNIRVPRMSVSPSVGDGAQSGANEKPSIATVRTQLDKWSVLGEADRLAQEAQAPELLISDLCLKGQATAIYAQPGAGKTMLMVYELVQAVAEGRVDPASIYYVNADDNGFGAAEKAKIFEEWGINMLIPGEKGFSASELVPEMRRMAAKKEAKGKTVILDTLKKFTSIMQKSEAAEFGKLCRQFVVAGGSVIVLAHTNKNLGADGKLTYAGTTDILEDFDAAYVAKLDQGVQPDLCSVTFAKLKGRSGNADEAVYVYNRNGQLSYRERLETMRRLDAEEARDLGSAIDAANDEDIVEAIEDAILGEVRAKSEILQNVSKSLSVPRHRVKAVLEKYENRKPLEGRWYKDVGAHNVHKYYLHEGDKY